jgi:D-tyrosyl-tRNA(Tyr) deacylase
MEIKIMKLVLQCVSHASVSVDENCIGKIDRGLLVFLGVGREDTKEIAEKMFQKMIKLRIFSDENGKTNLSLQDINGGLLIISQFTLYADCRKGNRPSFIHAGDPENANALYEYFIEMANKQLPKENVSHGEFGADMKVELLNDGPFTIVLDSDEILKK